MTIEQRELHRHDITTGRWVTLRRLERVLRIEVGTTGNALDAERKVRLVAHEVTAQPQVVVRAIWPVREVATDRIVGVIDDLSAELAGAASPDPDADLVQLTTWWLDLVESGSGISETEPRRDSRDDGSDLAADVLQRAYPLLETPVAAGARPRAIPIAAETLLRQRDPRTAAQRAFGRVTRPLVRALANALMPDEQGAIGWEPVVLALMAAGRCGPEQIVTILSTPAHQPGAVTFSPLDVQRARAMAIDRRPRRLADDLCAALREPGGTARLAAELSAWDARPPAPTPAPAAPPPQPAPAAAPRRPTPDPCGQPTPYPRRFRVVEGAEVAGHRVELVARPDDLLRWGEQLSNCLGAYRMEVARGRTHILGLTWGGELRVAIEVSPTGALRQLEAAGNMRPPPALETATLAFLRRHRLMDVDARRT